MARECNQQVKRLMCKQVNQAKLFRYYTEKVFFVFTRNDKVLTDLYGITLIATVQMLKSFTQCSCLWCFSCMRPSVYSPTQVNSLLLHIHIRTCMNNMYTNVGHIAG